MSPPDSSPISSTRTGRRLPAARSERRSRPRRPGSIRSTASTTPRSRWIDLDNRDRHVRRLAYDDGEWRCALGASARTGGLASIDRSTPSADLALTILSTVRRGPARQRGVEPGRRAQARRWHATLSTSRSAAAIWPDARASVRRLAEPVTTTAVWPGPGPVSSSTCSSSSPHQLRQRRPESESAGALLRSLHTLCTVISLHPGGNSFWITISTIGRDARPVAAALRAQPRDPLDHCIENGLESYAIPYEIASQLRSFHIRR